MATDSTFETAALTGVHWLGVVLALVTGAIHLVLGVRFIDQPLGVSFVLAGVAFVVAVGLFLVDYRRRLLYLVGVPFTGIQIVLYFVVNWPDVVSPVGVGDKVVQVALVVVCVILYQRES